MKKIVLVILMCGIFLVSLSAQATITRFAVVDMNRVASVYAGQSPEFRAFAEKRDKIQAEMDKQNKELQELNARLAEAQEKENQKEIKNLENQIRTKTQTLQTYIRNNFAELEKEQERLLNNEAFQTQLTNIIRGVAESEGFSMVLRKDNPAILWSSPSVDITNKVIERIRGVRR